MPYKQKGAKIFIVGAGIAGLSAAIALAKKGYAVTVLEQTKTFSEVGAGLQLSPNVTRILRYWDILASCKTYATQPENLNLRDGYTGQALLSIPLKELAENYWHAPYLTLHRADLQKILLEKVRTEPLITLIANAQLDNCKIYNENIFLYVKINNDIIEEKTDFLLCCDGVWSKTRSLFFATEPAVFTGYSAWRTTISREDFCTFLGNRAEINAWCGASNHIVTYPIKNGTYYNIVAITPSTNSSYSYSNTGDPLCLLKAFEKWNKELYLLLKKSAQWTYWPLFSMSNILLNFRNTVFFLGDSAHALLPFSAQGAAMAIEDAYHLAELFASIEHPSAIAEEYHNLRLPRLQRVSKRGSLNSFVYHATGVTAFMRNNFMRRMPVMYFVKQLDWLYNYQSEKF